MNPVPAAADGDENDFNVRRCALLLHSLGAADQAWLLERLTASQRAQVGALLEELRELGIAPDSHVARQLVHTESAKPDIRQEPQQATEPAARKALSRASASRMADVLKDEPAALLARLLQAGQWPWKDSWLELLPPAKRREVLQLIHSQVPATSMASAVVDAVATRLADVPARQSPVAGRSVGWPRWLGSRWDGGKAEAQQ